MVFVFHRYQYRTNTNKSYSTLNECPLSARTLNYYFKEVIIATQNLLTMGGFGSSFLHGSATALGGFYDADVTDNLPFYMLYQELVSQFPYSPVLYDLNTEPAK